MLHKHYWAIKCVSHIHTQKWSIYCTCVWFTCTCVLSCISMCVHVSNTCTCSSCLGRSTGPGKQCLVLSFVFYVPSKPGAQAALCGQEVAGLAPDWPMQLFTPLLDIFTCVRACVCEGCMCRYVPMCMYVCTVCVSACTDVCDMYYACLNECMYWTFVWDGVCVCVCVHHNAVLSVELITCLTFHFGGFHFLCFSLIAFSITSTDWSGRCKT